MTRLASQRSLSAFLLGAIGVLAAACGSTPNPAPIFERSPIARTAGTSVSGAPPVAAEATRTPRAALPKPPAANRPAPVPAPVARAKTEKLPPPEPAIISELPEEPTTKPYREGDWRPEFHVVQKGDTLYSIALDYGREYRELAAWNALPDPSLIKIDQRLRLFPQDNVAETSSVQPTPLPAPVAVPVYSEPKARKLPYSEQALAQLKMPATGAAANPISPATVSPAVKLPTAPAVAPPTYKETPGGESKMVWEWPAQGTLLYSFGQGSNQKGVGIEGQRGQPVMAAAPGKVVYSGSGLRGYGKLIIIKHDASYLSVYAHNSQILVKEGQSVAKGQKIAEIGDTDSDRMALHFEIRRLGKPIDPLQYLPERAS